MSQLSRSAVSRPRSPDAWLRSDDLVGRLAAIEAAGAALRSLGAPWPGQDGLPGNGPAIIRLAIAASTTEGAPQ
jgi:hypothetical protein